MLLCREVEEGAGATKLPTVSYLVIIVTAGLVIDYWKKAIGICWEIRGIERVCKVVDVLLRFCCWLVLLLVGVVGWCCCWL
jgi:hypothetical protein